MSLASQPVPGSSARPAANGEPVDLTAFGPPIVAAFTAAIVAADGFRGATAPNPPVGCVILDARGDVLAIAAHEKAGTQHAEAKALQICRDSGLYDRIHAVVVTLEPCNHWGRTPPCTDAVLASPARILWFGTSDPNPAVAGGGAARLRAAGVLVRPLAEAPDDAFRTSLTEACAALIAAFAKRQITGRPYVTIKQALDRDGSMIPPPGRTTFTSEAALTFAHRLRRRADALITGSGTILADDPAFTVRRVADFPGKRRPLVVLDRRGRVPESYRQAAVARGFDVRIEPDLAAALDRLGASGVLEVLVEAGPGVTQAVLDAHLWDEHVIIRRSGDGAEVVDILRADDTPSQGEAVLRRMHVAPDGTLVPLG